MAYDQNARTSAARAADRFFYSQRGRDDSWSEAWWTEQIAIGLAELGLSPELAIQIQARRATLPSTWWLDPDAIEDTAMVDAWVMDGRLPSTVQAALDRW